MLCPRPIPRSVGKAERRAVMVMMVMVTETVMVMVMVMMMMMMMMMPSGQGSKQVRVWGSFNGMLRCRKKTQETRYDQIPNLSFFSLSSISGIARVSYVNDLLAQFGD